MNVAWHSSLDNGGEGTTCNSTQANFSNWMVSAI